jgi:hypothetical protein
MIATEKHCSPYETHPNHSLFDGTSAKEFPILYPFCFTPFVSCFVDAASEAQVLAGKVSFPGSNITDSRGSQKLMPVPHAFWSVLANEFWHARL